MSSMPILITGENSPVHYERLGYGGYSRLTLYNKASLVEDFTPTQTPYALISVSQGMVVSSCNSVLEIQDLF